MAFVVAAFATTISRRAAERALADAGHTCLVFDAAAAAVREVQAGKPDVLIVDSRLTDLGTAQICDVLRGSPATADIPILICDPGGGDADPRLGRRVLVTALTPAAMLGAISQALHAPAPRADSPGERVLLVEDDDAIAEPLIDGLAHYGIHADRVATGTAALAAPRPALVLLDLGLPDMDGLEVCRQLRLTGDMPVIMLTARGDETDRVVGLELGADDYLAKPFSLRELVARIRAVSRRAAAQPADSQPAIPAAA